MDRIKYLMIIFFLSFSLQCDKIELAIDCSECYQIAPEWGEIYVQVTINDENNFVPLIIFIGNVEDYDIEYIDTAYGKDYYLEVPLNRYYSVMAEYISGYDTICAVDGDEIKIKKNTEDCDEECYIIKGGQIDVRLHSDFQ